MTNYRISLASLFEPEQTRPDRGSKYASPRRFQEWLESLPLGNMTAAGNELLAAIQELNQLRISARIRSDILERALEPILTVVDVLDRHIVETSFPLDEKQDRVGRVAVRFLQELAMGHRIVAHQLSGDGSTTGFLHKKAVASHLHASMASTLQMMLRLGMLYQPMPEGGWFEINSLYLFARNNGLHQRTFVNRLVKGDMSIEQLYMRMALFAVSGPERMGQRALRALFEATVPWVESCRMVDSLAAEKPEPMFELDPLADEPPILIPQERFPGKFAMVFDIRKLRDDLESQQRNASDEKMELTFTESTGTRLVVDRDLVEQLLSSWGLQRRRSFRRMEAQHSVQMIVGIDAVHYTLAGDSTFPRFLREYGDPKFTESAARERSLFGFVDDGTGRPIRHKAEVLNQSIGGYRLRLKHPKHLQLRVGELVAICPTSISGELESWLIGTIRWLHAIDVRELEIGIGLVARTAIPSALMATDDNDAPPHRALLTRGYRLDDDQRALIVPVSVQTRKPTALCIGNDMETYCGAIEFTERLERNGEIGRYRFERTETGRA